MKQEDDKRARRVRETEIGAAARVRETDQASLSQPSRAAGERETSLFVLCVCLH